MVESYHQRTIRQVVTNVLRLTSATGAAQLIALAAAPLISRLYEPAAFGHFAVVLAIVTLLLPLASLRYELALVLPEEEEQAVHLLALALLLVVASSVVLVAVIPVVLPFVIDGFHLTSAQVMEVPLAVSMMGTHAAIMGWLVRQRAIAQMGSIRFATVIGTALAQIAFGCSFGGPSGLFLGFVTGYAVGIAVAVRHCRQALAKCLSGVTLSTLTRVALEYRAFAIFSAPSGIINVLGFQIVNLFMPALYGSAVAGQSALAGRVVGQPAVLVGSAVNQVFWPDAARLFAEAPERLWHLFLRINLILLTAMLPAVLLTFVGGEIFGFVFGAAWRQAGTFAGVFILAQILGLPTHATNCLHGYRLNHWMSAWDIGRLAAVGLAFGISWRFSLSPVACVGLFTVASGLANLVLFALNAVVILHARSHAARRPPQAVAPPLVEAKGTDVKRKNGLDAVLPATAAAMVMVLSPPVLAQSANRQLYVSTTGSDTNPGTPQAPFRTIPRAAQAAAPGTVIHVAPGIYEGGFKTTASGTATAPIQYRSDKKWSAKLVPPSHSESEMAWDNRGDYVTIEGFEVDGAATRAGIPWADGIYAAGSHDVVAHNLIHNIARDLPCASHGGAGIGTDHFYYGIANNVIANIVHDIGPGTCTFFHGIYIATSGDVINNVVYNAAFVGIHLWHDASDVNIINNTVSHNRLGILVGSGDQYHREEPNDYTKVINNIVVKNSIGGIKEHGKTGSHNVYLSNLVWENGEYDYGLQNGLKDGKPIKDDPKFHKDGTDFRLDVGSPAIDNGDAGNAPASDIDGVSRPQGAGYDIGAYEYVEAQ